MAFTDSALVRRLLQPLEELETAARAEAFARLAYRIVLRREIDEGALENWRRELKLDFGKLVPLVNSLFVSPEYNALLRRQPEPGRLMLNSLHLERCRLVSALPKARHILDLGGATSNDPRGALVVMGYPHHFETLTIVDVPPGASLEQANAKTFGELQTDQGLIKYVYRSMTDLPKLALPAESVDLVWMGQSIEHVSEAAIDEMLPAMLAVLRPGGSLVLDTPNRRVTKLESPDCLIHPDHKIEYERAGLEAKLRQHGFDALRTTGIGKMSRGVAEGRFDAIEVIECIARNDSPEDSYVLVVEAKKPLRA